MCDGNVVDDAINFARRYKMIIAPVALGAAAVVGLKTIFSLGKEMGAKEQSAQPINEKQLNQKV